MRSYAHRRRMKRVATRRTLRPFVRLERAQRRGVFCLVVPIRQNATGEKGMKSNILERACEALGAPSTDELLKMIREGRGLDFIGGLSDEDKEILDRWYRSRQDPLGR